MARLHGKNGSLIVGGTTYACTNWSLDYAGAADEATGMDSSGVAAFVGGITRWTASASGVWESGTILPVPAVSVACSFKLSNTAGQLMTGNAITTSAKCETAVDGVIKWSVEMQGTGALTPNTA